MTSPSRARSDAPSPTAVAEALAEIRRADPAAVITEADPGVTSVRIAPHRLEAAAARLATLAGVRFADLFGAGTPPMLHVIYAVDAGHQYLHLSSSAVDNRLPNLSSSTPAAFVEECELFEQFGLHPAADSPLNRLAMPPHIGDLPRLGNVEGVQANVHAAHAVEGHAFEFPVGPVRGVATESLYYGLVTSGEEVVDLYLFTWHKHRGIERRLNGLFPERALFYVERAEGLSAVANTWAFAAAVERAQQLTVQPRAAVARGIYLELERLYNHAACLAALGQATGILVGQAHAEIALEKFLRLNAAVAGHRYLFGTISLGGVDRLPDLDLLARMLGDVHTEFHHVLDPLLRTNSFVDRLEATGLLSTRSAHDLGLVGPIARGTGVPADARADHPHAPYDNDFLRPITAGAGDALARLQVMAAEVDASTQMIRGWAQADLPPTPLDSSRPPRNGSALGWAESARGESLAWVNLDDHGRIQRARLRPASVRNWRAFDDAVRSQNVFTDVPIIEASFWLTVAGRAL